MIDITTAINDQQRYPLPSISTMMGYYFNSVQTFSLLFLLVSSLNVSAQDTIKGMIFDAQTKTGLANASVYFPELHLGAFSDVNGQFKITVVNEGIVLMQVSHIGYKTFFVKLNLPQDSTIQVNLLPSRTQMQEVVVTGTQLQAPDETSFNVAQLNREAILEKGSRSISDATAQLPGASQLTTGPGISKPVIRGLYGNRIQINVNGLRFDNQQWQDEHGLGVSDMGIDRIEVIRGASAVLYGSDAMGGVLNVIEERPAPVNSKTEDLNARLYTNTYGLSLNYGVKKSTENHWSKLRVGFDNHADYSDGKNRRILNSRFASYNIKASWGRSNDNSIHVFNVMASHSMFGFVFDSLSRKEKDPRLSRSFDGPHHTVSFLQATSENTYYRRQRKIKLNAGFISNLRLEDEGGGGISLSMLLNTINVQGQITQQVGLSGEWTYGSSVLFQTNTNFGGRIIIPDAMNGEGSVFSFYNYHVKRWLFEGGLRYDLKFIETFATKNLNVIGNDSPTREIVPFTNLYHAANFSIGTAYRLTEEFTFKINASSGYRPGNLAELSSNGLHEGTLRWEIGIPDAKVEQNLNIEGSLHYTSHFFNSSVSFYHNGFKNFFYLAPTGNEFYGFNIYRYEQSDARLQGGEVAGNWNPGGAWFEINGSYSFINAKKANGEYLPFIPANKLMSELKFHLKTIGDITSPTLKIGGNYVFDQHRPAQFETSTNAYFLLYAGFSAERRTMRFSLICNNLLNKNYFDHLSRFKYYGIGNMGRDIVMSLNFKL